MAWAKPLKTIRMERKMFENVPSFECTRLPVCANSPPFRCGRTFVSHRWFYGSRLYFYGRWRSRQTVLWAPTLNPKTAKRINIIYIYALKLHVRDHSMNEWARRRIEFSRSRPRYALGSRHSFHIRALFSRSTRTSMHFHAQPNTWCHRQRTFHFQHICN